MERIGYFPAEALTCSMIVMQYQIKTINFKSNFRATTFFDDKLNRTRVRRIV
jgi:hypothetical protein